MSSRESRDIQKTVILLTTHVKKSDEYYWVKLKLALKYIKVTRELKLALSVGDM